MRKSMLLLLPLFLLGCQEAPTSPPAETPHYDWMNNPDNGNVSVVRFETHTAICWTDPDTGLRACHSTIPLGGGTEPDCGPQELLDPVSRQEIGEYDPADVFGSWLRVNQKGEAWITVRDTRAAGTCFGNALVAEGWGRLHYTDNDLFGSNGTDHNANSWGFGAQGRLIRPDGTVGVYHGQNRFRYNDLQGLHVVAATAVVN